MFLPKFTRAFLNVTDACNLRCRYCFVNWQNNYMSYQTAKDAVDMLLNNAEEMNTTANVTFFGGEPLLMWNKLIKPIIEYIRVEKRNDCALSVTTNGTLLTEEIMMCMKQNKVGILFSIDGGKQTQDYNRPSVNGEGSFDLLENNIDKIVSYFPNTIFRSTIIPDTCEYTWDNIKFAIDRGYKSFFTIPNVFEHLSEEKRAILAEQLHKYSEYYVDCYRQNTNPIIFNTMEAIMKKVRDINMSVKYDRYRTMYYCAACGKCGLGTNSACSISPNGDIFACQEMPSNCGKDSIFYIGSIYDGIDNAKRLALAESYEPPKAKGGECEKCKLNRICDGGCVANNYLINGDIHISSEIYCWWQQLLLSEVEWIIKILGEERNERFKEYWTVINRGR